MFLLYIFFNLIALLSDILSLILGYFILLLVPPVGFIVAGILVYFEYVTAENVIKEQKRIRIRKKQKINSAVADSFRWDELVAVSKNEILQSG